MPDTWQGAGNQTMNELFPDFSPSLWTKNWNKAWLSRAQSLAAWQKADTTSGKVVRLGITQSADKLLILFRDFFSFILLSLFKLVLLSYFGKAISCFLVIS